jgi:hypothetical protein
MAITGVEAASALADIERMQRRTTVAAGYNLASPHLVVWGLVWLLGYAACGMLPLTRWGYAWLPLIVLGIAASVWFGVRTSARASGTVHKRAFERSILATIAITVFLSCVGFVVGPIPPDSVIVIPALVLGLVYTLAGLATLPRYAWIGAIIFITTMAGYWLARPLLPFWIAGFGGGGLIVGGLWLRKV